MTKVYSLNSAVRLHWTNWDDELVVFDEISGQTHELDTLRAFVLNAISESPQTIDLLCSQIEEVMRLEYSAEMKVLLAKILEEFETHGLIQGKAK